jgi:hypothetical protein
MLRNLDFYELLRQLVAVLIAHGFIAVAADLRDSGQREDGGQDTSEQKPTRDAAHLLRRALIPHCAGATHFASCFLCLDYSPEP